MIKIQLKYKAIIPSGTVLGVLGRTLYHYFTATVVYHFDTKCYVHAKNVISLCFIAPFFSLLYILISVFELVSLQSYLFTSVVTGNTV